MSQEETILSFLPLGGRDMAWKTLQLHERAGKVLSEIRLRRGHFGSLTFYREGETENGTFSVSPSR